MLNKSGNHEEINRYDIDPIVKLNRQIDTIEDNLMKTEKINIRKLKNIGKKYNRECLK
jgi:hypothetical protein